MNYVCCVFAELGQGTHITRQVSTKHDLVCVQDLDLSTPPRVRALFDKNIKFLEIFFGLPQFGKFGMKKLAHASQHLARDQATIFSRRFLSADRIFDGFVEILRVNWACTSKQSPNSHRDATSAREPEIHPFD